MKRFLFFFMLVIIWACAPNNGKNDGCPPIDIPRETLRNYQNDFISDKFQINIVGVESYCYKDPRNQRYYAAITPLFKIRRLEQSNVTSLDAPFYIKTVGADRDYLGRRNYSQSLNIPAEVKEYSIKGKQTLTQIAPPPYDNFKMEVGLELSADQNSRTRKMFDIDYRYFSAEEIAAQNEPATEEVYLEIEPDEKVIYSECSGKPEVVKKNQLPKKCGN